MEDKIIFLDIDGVLNVIGQGRDEFGQTWHPHFMDNLRWIIEQTGAKIVISSTWRMSGLSEMQRMWRHRNLAGEVVGITPHVVEVSEETGIEYLDDVDRGHEIQQYIKDHDVKTYCIIDDDNDMLPSQQLNFVRTANNQHHPDCVDIGYGLTMQCADRVVHILNKNDAR